VSEPHGAVLVEAGGLCKSYPRDEGWLARSARSRGSVRAVDRVDLEIRTGETVGLVGESGSGKSTLGRLLIRLVEPDRGRVRFDGVDLGSLSPAELRRKRREFQIVFQDAAGSLDPRMRVGRAVGEPLAAHGLARGRAERHERVVRLFERVGLDEAAMRRYPHEFSGGQRQRIGIARAIACSPRFLVADEPVSALDASVQAQILELLIDLRRQMGLACLFIAHDLRLVEHVSDRVAVMYLGRIVEHAPAAALFARPLHPYTQALLASTPRLHAGVPTAPAVTGEPPSPALPPGGCPFHPRCPVAEAVCRSDEPPLVAVEPGHGVACHLVRAGVETRGDRGA
jgi:oligopeptide/dipeptide ABC transporter ATP-binding protein